MRLYFYLPTSFAQCSGEIYWSRVSSFSDTSLWRFRRCHEYTYLFTYEKTALKNERITGLYWKQVFFCCQSAWWRVILKIRWWLLSWRRSSISILVAENNNMQRSANVYNISNHVKWQTTSQLNSWKIEDGSIYDLISRSSPLCFVRVEDWEVEQLNLSCQVLPISCYSSTMCTSPIKDGQVADMLNELYRARVKTQKDELLESCFFF